MEKEKDKDKGMLKSLRKKGKKSVPSSRKQSMAPPGGGPKYGKEDQQRVADLLKRRQSGRFISAPMPINSNVPGVPTMPAIPKEFANYSVTAATSSGASRPSTRQGSASRSIPQDAPGVLVNMTDYQTEGFSAGDYISNILRNASEEDVRRYQDELKRSRKRTSADLQSNVYVNRTQFISISKEIDNVKNEMRTLRNLLGELDVTTQSLKTASDGDISPGLAPQASAMNSLLSPNAAPQYDRRNRNSVADLTQMWATHLRLLWDRVENSQKYLPASPGRHIIMDSPQWVELNSATWKPMRQVHMFLLNDHLLAASLKKRRPDAANRGGPPTKLFAEHCWPLGDVEMIDLASSSSETCAINIRVAKESYVYRSDKADKKAKLLMTFKKTLDEHKKAQRAETEDQNRIRDNVSFFTSRDPALQDQGDLLRTISASMGKDKPMILIEVEGTQRNLRWVETQMDELDELIAHRQFEEAVSRIEFLRGIAAKHVKSNTVASEFITFRVDERALRLSGLIAADLKEYVSWKSYVKKNADWLVRLEFEDRAREALLDARSAILKLRTRQVRFEGDIPSYVSQVAIVQFTLIRNTVETYNACFEYKLSSPLVKWAKEHVEGYSDLLTRQLASVSPEDDVYDQCVQYTLLHSTLLTDVGLDFKELLMPRQPQYLTGQSQHFTRPSKYFDGHLDADGDPNN